MCRIPIALGLIVPMVGTVSADDGPSEEQVARALRVQSAMVRARQLIREDRADEAVRSLERELMSADGNAVYLTLLRDAYTAQLRSLSVAQAPDDQIARVRERIRSLGGESSPPPAPREPIPEPIVRSDPFQQEPLDDQQPQPAPEPKPRRAAGASAAFRAERFAEAHAGFRAAIQAGEELNPVERNQWAYCRLHVIVPMLNAGPGEADPRALVKAITEARADCGTDQMRAFADRLMAHLRQQQADRPVVRGNDPGDGWQTLSTANFRVRYRSSREAAEEAARVAELTRDAVFEKWGDRPGSGWKPACVLSLYDDAKAFAAATGKSPSLPGNARVQQRGGRVVARQIDLRRDDPNWLKLTLPYEVAHLVLTDLFPEQPLPRWAGEAMAVLAQPADQVARYLRSLSDVRGGQQWLPLGKLLMSTGFPEAALITPFYVESVSVVSYLVGLKGAKHFTLFLRDGQRYGLEKALTRQYGIDDFASLERHWLTAALER